MKDQILDNVLQAIGKTPLVRLNRFAPELSAEILVKVETVNPGGSIKDRVGARMLETALADGRLKPGGTVIEATAGNTGVGLAMAAAVHGLRCIFVLPDKMSREKIALLRAYGAEVVVTPSAVPPDSPESYNGVADRLGREIPGAFRPSQFDNPDNPLAHYATTGPEIWEATGGRLDAFVSAMGTAGTISGTGKFLKEQDSNIQVIGADPEGSIYSGDSPKPWLVEGIGEDFIPKTFNRQVVDEVIRVSDKESFNAGRRLASFEGILAGGSSGTALAAAVKYAQRFTEKKRIVVVLPDTGRNYLTKMYDDQWMSDHGLLESGASRRALLRELERPAAILLSVSPEDSLGKAVSLLGSHGISQLPVLKDGKQVGSLSESTLVRQLQIGGDLSATRVGDVMAKPFPELDARTPLDEAVRVLLSGHSAVLMVDGGVPRQVITRFDLITFGQVQEA